MWVAHTKLAREAGVPEETITVVGTRDSLDALSQDEALIVRFGRELLHDHRVADATFEAARARFGNKGVTDLTVTFGYFAMAACALNAFDMEPAPGEYKLP